jgi:hypothetical protein
MECRPHCLQILADFERERIDQTLRKLELALATYDVGRAYRILSVFDEENQEHRRPLEALGIHSEIVSVLNRAGLETVQHLRNMPTEQLRELPLTENKRKELIKIRDVLERS